MCQGSRPCHIYVQLGFAFLQLKPVALFLFENMVYAWFVIRKKIMRGDTEPFPVSLKGKRKNI